jgi:hypothetical protein
MPVKDRSYPETRDEIQALERISGPGPDPDGHWWHVQYVRTRAPVPRVAPSRRPTRMHARQGSN